MPFIFAYLDAGSGSLIIQAVIAALVAGPILLRNKISEGMRAIRNTFRRDTQESHQAQDSPNR